MESINATSTDSTGAAVNGVFVVLISAIAVAGAVCIGCICWADRPRRSPRLLETPVRRAPPPLPCAPTAETVVVVEALPHDVDEADATRKVVTV